MAATISIIIPTYQEEQTIGALLKYLVDHKGKGILEIIVSDGGSTDQTMIVAARMGARAVTSPVKGRAAQMNFGASIATAEVFYFVHADSFPPITFVRDIVKAVDEGYSSGRYRTRFDSRMLILKVNAFFTRFDWFICYGGDQTLFMTRELFNSIAGFDSGMLIMEDYDITVRAKRVGRYKIFGKAALVSARKYDTNSWWRVQMANRKIVAMYRKGASQEEMRDEYRRLLNYR